MIGLDCIVFLTSSKVKNAKLLIYKICQNKPFCYLPCRNLIMKNFESKSKFFNFNFDFDKSLTLSIKIVNYMNNYKEFNLNCNFFVKFNITIAMTKVDLKNYKNFDLNNNNIFTINYLKNQTSLSNIPLEIYRNNIEENYKLDNFKIFKNYTIDFNIKNNEMLNSNFPIVYNSAIENKQEFYDLSIFNLVKFFKISKI